MQLEAVLDRPEELVRAVESRRVSRLDVARSRELTERFKRVARPHRLIVTAVHELQQLHGELDVADPAPAALQLAFGQTLLARLRLRARLHRADLAHRVGIERVRPDIRRDQREKPVGEVRVAAHGSCLQQRLELPRSRPSVVVRAVAVETAAERPGASLGTQVGVGAKDDPVSRRLGHHAEDGAGHMLGHLRVSFVHEEHVDVARVIELRPAELAHPDDGERHIGCGEADRALETCLCQSGELTTDSGKIGDGQEVAGRGAQQLAPLPTAERAPSFGVVAVVRRRDDRRGAIFLERLLTVEPFLVAQRDHELGVGNDGSSERTGHRGDGDQAVAQQPFPDERFRKLGVRFQDATQRAARGDRVCRRVERGDDPRCLQHRRGIPTFTHGGSVARCLHAHAICENFTSSGRDRRLRL